MFEGVIMPELYLTDALGCNGKPMIRVHTAGSVGGSTAIVAASHVHSGVFKRVLTVTFETHSESNAMWALSTPPPFTLAFNCRWWLFLCALDTQIYSQYCCVV